MRAGRFLAVVAASVTGLAGPARSVWAQGGELVDLMPRFEDGATSRYEVNYSTSTRGTGTELPEGGLTTRTTLNATVSLTVRGIADGEAMVMLRYERVRLSIDPGLSGLARSFDTAGAPEAEGGAETGQSLRLLVGAPTVLRVGVNGEVREVEPPEGITPTSPAGAALKAFTTSQGIRGWLGPVLCVHAPDRVAPVGARWMNDQRRETVRGVEVRMNTSYQVKSSTGGHATIEVNGSGTLAMIGAPGLTGGVRGLELKESVIEGIVVWDLGAGLATQVDTVEREVWTSQPEGRAVTTASAERRLMVRRLAEAGEDAAPGAGAPDPAGAK